MAAMKVRGGKMVAATRKYRLGDMYSSDFDYDGMMAMFRKAMAGQMSLQDMQRLSDSMEDVNYHADNKKLQDKIKGVVSNAGGANKVEISTNLSHSMQALGIIDGQLAGMLQYLDRIGNAQRGNEDGLKLIDTKVLALRKEVAALENALNKLGVSLLK